jgi:hypothetical protein
MTNYIPHTPERNSATEIVTYQDAIDRLLIHFDRPAGERDLYLMRKSVADALRQMGNHPWTWYSGRYTLQTEADYVTGTIAYDHATRTVTLTGGTWPANAALGSIKIANTVYLVATRVSDTEITLREDGNPGANVAALTTYYWFRESYLLPPNFIGMEEPQDVAGVSGGADILRVRQGTVLAARRSYAAVPAAYPQYFTIERDPRREGRSVTVSPPPSEARTYEFIYRRSPRPPTVVKYSTGTATSTNASATVTGSGTTWSSRHVGCVLRISEVAGIEPTGPYGSRQQTGDLDVQCNAAALTRVIIAVPDATHLTLDSAADVSLSGMKYTISDAMDVDWETCGEYFDRLTEYMFAVGAHETAKADHQTDPIRQRYNLSQEAYDRAACRDLMNDARPGNAPWWAMWPWFTNAWWPQ